ncbi:hypothetical protein GCM10010420_07900 [Streptomyces glaucosporus]|uniref:Serine/threonine protein kinase n=1 Tax=Streptomyces glaucosporus TaxID=284044 RepID=A0ABP5UX47_9ACTN
MSAFPPPPAESSGPPPPPRDLPQGPSQDGPQDGPGAPARRRGRTAPLIACAALLGTVAGTAVGYTVQADRAPTPLPPLSQAELSYPDKPLPKGKEPEPLTAGQDRRVRTDGDLRELLVKRPRGAREPDLALDDGWLSPSAYASKFEHPDHMFTTLVQGQGLRRVASVSWEEGRYREVRIDLVQFREDRERSAAGFVAEQQAYMSGADHAGNGGKPLKGSGNGRYYVYDEPRRKPGYLPMYQVRAIAQRGDVAMDIHVYDSEPISERYISSLAERQLERL